MKKTLSWVLILVLVLALAASVTAGLLGLWPDLRGDGGSHSTRPGLVAKAAGAVRCEAPGWTITIDRKDVDVYSCLFRRQFRRPGDPPTRMVCIAYANGIATDITENVQEAFADVLGARPACISY
jgi:hypothetical protein